jgi:hypothetical protein
MGGSDSRPVPQLDRVSSFHSDKVVSNPDDALHTCSLSNLDTARKVLRAHGLLLGDLPRIVDDPTWDELRRSPFHLTLPQLIALRSYVLYPNVSDLRWVPDEFSRSSVSTLRNCLDSVADVTVREALLTAHTYGHKRSGGSAP